MCVGSPTAGAWSSFQRRPDDEFETDSFRAYIEQILVLDSADPGDIVMTELGRPVSYRIGR